MSVKTRSIWVAVALGAALTGCLFSLSGCGGDDAGGSGNGHPPLPDAGGLDAEPRPQVERIFSEQPVDDCGDVPTSGRCKDDATIESCFVPEALAEEVSLAIVTVSCDPGEHCLSDESGARCEPDSECVSGTTECLDASSLRTCVDGSWQISSCGSCIEGSEHGASCIANAPGTGGVFVRGRLTFEHRVAKADLTGFEPTPAVDGAAGLLVHVYDGALIGVGRTFTGGAAHNAGDFEIELASKPSKTASIHFYPIDRDWQGNPRVAVAVASQPEQQVQLSNAYYSWRTDVCVDDAACADATIDLGEIRISEQNDSGAIHIFQWLNYGMAQLRLIYPTLLQPSLVAFWSRKNDFACGACFLGQQFAGAKVFPGGSHVDRYDTSIALSKSPPFHDLPSVITHELGHFVMAAYSRPSSEGGPHLIDTTALPGLAWSEGWATFYGQSILSEDLFDPDPVHFSMSKQPKNPPFWANLELRTSGSPGTPPMALPAPQPLGPIDQPVNEIMIGSIVWSLWAKGRAATPQGLGDQPIFEALRGARMRKVDRGHEGVDVVDFLDALACYDELLVPDITEVVTAAGYPWQPEDVLCAP